MTAPIEDPFEAMIAILTHWQAGAYGLALALGLSLLAAFVLRLRAAAPWLGTDRGGAVTVLVIALCTSASAGLVEGTGITIAVLATGLYAAVLAVGGRQWLRRILWPADGSGTPWLDWAWLRWLLGDKDNEPITVADRAEYLYARYRASVLRVKSSAHVRVWSQLNDAEKRGWMTAAKE